MQIEKGKRCSKIFWIMTFLFVWSLICMCYITRTKSGNRRWFGQCHWEGVHYRYRVILAFSLRSCHASSSLFVLWKVNRCDELMD